MFCFPLRFISEEFSKGRKGSKKKKASQKDMWEIMGGHVFIFAHFLVPKSKLISYHFSLVEGYLQGCHCLLELPKGSPMCPCFLISFQARHRCAHAQAPQCKTWLCTKKLISNPRVLLFLFFLNNCFPYFFLTNSANILYLKEITLAHVGVWVSRMASLSQLELDGCCNYLGKEHFPKFT